MATRYSPGVLPDDRPRERPGLEIAEAFDYIRRQGIEDQEAAYAEELRDRERARRPAEDAALERAGALEELEFDDQMRDRGYVPAESGNRVRTPPTGIRDVFQEVRERTGLTGDHPLPQPDDVFAPEEPGEVVAIPGQFIGGNFSEGIVRAPTRSIAGRDYRFDPSQTAGARGAAAERAAFDEEVRTLVRAGVDPNVAPAAARFDLEGDFVQPPEPLDPEKGEFESDEARDAFLAFRRSLGIADEEGARARAMEVERERTGRARMQEDARTERANAPGSPRARNRISVEDAIAELDQMYGIFDESGIQVGSHLTNAQKVQFAEAWANGELNPADLPERPEPQEQPEEEQDERGFIRKVFDFFRRGGDDTTGTGPVPSRAGPAPIGAAESTADSIRAVVRDYPGVPATTLQAILEEEGFAPQEIEDALSGR